MHFILISAAIGAALGWLAAYLFTGTILFVFTAIVAVLIIYGWLDATNPTVDGSAVIGMLLIFGPGIVCFLIAMWGTHLYFALMSPDIDWDAVRRSIFR